MPRRVTQAARRPVTLPCLALGGRDALAKHPKVV